MWPDWRFIDDPEHLCIHVGECFEYEPTIYVGFLIFFTDMMIEFQIIS